MLVGLCENVRSNVDDKISSDDNNKSTTNDPVGGPDERNGGRSSVPLDCGLGM